MMEGMIPLRILPGHYWYDPAGDRVVSTAKKTPQVLKARRLSDSSRRWTIGSFTYSEKDVYAQLKVNHGYKSFQVGDRVQVIYDGKELSERLMGADSSYSKRQADDGQWMADFDDWEDVWVEEMSACVGKTGIVRDVDSDIGVAVDFDDGGDHFRFPATALKTVAPVEKDLDDQTEYRYVVFTNNPIPRTFPLTSKTKLTPDAVVQSLVDHGMIDGKALETGYRFVVYEVTDAHEVQVQRAITFSTKEFTGGTKV